MKANHWAAVLAGAMLAGCGSMSTNMNPMNWWGSGPQEQSLAQFAGATRYRCDAGKQFAVRLGAQAQQPAMVILPDREFRLDPVAGAPEARYSNGRTTLTTKGDEAALEEAGTALYANCKRADSPPG